MGGSNRDLLLNDAEMINTCLSAVNQTISEGGISDGEEHCGSERTETEQEGSDSGSEVQNNTN